MKPDAALRGLFVVRPSVHSPRSAMMPPRPRPFREFFVALTLIAAYPLLAVPAPPAMDVPRPPTQLPAGVSEMGVVIKMRPATGAAVALPGWPIAVHPGAELTLHAPQFGATADAAYRWTRDKAPLPDSAAVLHRAAASAADSGSYEVEVVRKSDGVAWISAPTHVLVRPGSHQPLINVSTRAALSPTSPRLVVGFVIPERVGIPSTLKFLLLRAIGPALAEHGVDQPLPDPRLRLYNAAGEEVTPSRAFAQVIHDDGSTPESLHIDWVRRTAAAVGAFPVPMRAPGELHAANYSEIAELPPGAYTAVVESAEGNVGDVLVEIYEVGM